MLTTDSFSMFSKKILIRKMDSTMDEINQLLHGENEQDDTEYVEAAAVLKQLETVRLLQVATCDMYIYISSTIIMQYDNFLKF